ncbi:phosphoenolpyruvate carboxylase [Candidatus Jordarchaeum sp.]|uniref:phosphoenolpyruvate carboxylase n=1 Tax=Candidatus Jordarchaeum sp. TaxID=2823881 RepID=UPI00404A64B7
MSSQHPDNVRTPFFASQNILGGEDEIKEAYYVFSHLGCDEQMWDMEGKEVDNFVVVKLLSNYDYFFKENKLGEDIFLTLRIPNPAIEKTEAKILVETLDSIPRSFDASKIFYGEDHTPIFEVILPMTQSPEQLNRVYFYYKEFVVGNQNKTCFQGDIPIKNWIGEFKPEEINVIPLIEDMTSMLNADQIVGDYLKDKKFDYQRVFLARSDPALNYSLVSAVIMNKIALQKLYFLEQDLSLEIYPILGVGSPPFRGGMTPTSEDRVLEEYPSVQTFTLQSAFKYDYPEQQVMESIKRIKEKSRGKSLDLDVTLYQNILEELSKEYEREIMEVAPLINQIASYIPQRRKRKLHIGLFGYSRGVGRAVLPRAITFCAALYSLGIPPEVFGLSVLNPQKKDVVRDIYKNFDDHISSALQYLNQDNLKLLHPNLAERIREIAKEFEFETNHEHKNLTTQIVTLFKQNEPTMLQEKIIEAGALRGFLG